MLGILADASDRVAAAVASAAATRGVEVHWLTPLELVNSSWTHRLEDGVVTEIRTADGRRTRPEELGGLLNRVGWLPAAPFVKPEDREYAVMEQHALLTSVIAGMPCPVVNPVKPPSLAGPLLTPARWLALASRIGASARGLQLTTDGRRWQRRGWEAVDWRALTTPGMAEVPLHPAVPAGHRPVAWLEPVDPYRSVTVAGRQVLGAPDRRWEKHCLGLAGAAGCGLLEVRLARRRSDGGVVVTGCEPTPATIPAAGAEVLVDLLAAPESAQGMQS